MGDTWWIDGGTGIDTIPIYSLIGNPDVKEAYLICYNSALTSGGGTVPPELDRIKILKNALATFDDMRVDLYKGSMSIAEKSDTISFSFIPVLNTTFSVLDFNNEQYEYELTYEWAVKNTPVPMN
jgi:hypothetical protein